MDTSLLVLLCEQIHKNNQAVANAFEITHKTVAKMFDVVNKAIAEALKNLAAGIVSNRERIERLEKEIEEIKADMPPDIKD